MSDKKKLWKVFSEYIRKRDRDLVTGLSVCFTCGLQRDYKQLQAGHGIPRAAGGLILYFHEMNVHTQCYRCNINLGGNGVVYNERLRDLYGDGIIKALQDAKNIIVKYSPEDYRALTALYQEKIKLLDNADI